MELITDAKDEVAPRLSDVTMSAAEALKGHETVISYVVAMLCVGIVHGDLSEFNILVDKEGPVIIDLPQAVDAASNNHAESMLQRDVDNVRNYYGQFAPELLDTRYAQEIWALYAEGELSPESKLTGYFAEDTSTPDVESVLTEISAAEEEEQARLERILDASETG